MRDQAAVLYRCIVPLSLLCPTSKPMAIQIIQWKVGKSICYGGRSSQSGLAQVKLPNPGVTLSTVEKARARTVSQICHGRLHDLEQMTQVAPACLSAVCKHCDGALLISENL